jgi:hypothetical protein
LHPGDLPPETYLAGGTAIALWIGHRQFVDLDWFTPQEFDEKVATEVRNKIGLSFKEA